MALVFTAKNAVFSDYLDDLAIMPTDGLRAYYKFGVSSTESVKNRADTSASDLSVVFSDNPITFNADSLSVFQGVNTQFLRFTDDVAKAPTMTAVVKVISASTAKILSHALSTLHGVTASSVGSLDYYEVVVSDEGVPEKDQLKLVSLPKYPTTPYYLMMSRETIGSSVRLRIATLSNGVINSVESVEAGRTQRTDNILDIGRRLSNPQSVNVELGNLLIYQKALTDDEFKNIAKVLG